MCRIGSGNAMGAIKGRASRAPYLGIQARVLSRTGRARVGACGTVRVRKQAQAEGNGCRVATWR